MSEGPSVETVAEMFADRYRVVERLSWNGLALLYRAVRPNGESLVVGLLPIDAEGSPAIADRFRTQADALEHLVEPGMVRVTGHGIAHGVPFLEMQYVEGATTLAEELEEGPLDRDQAMAITAELLDILGNAQTLGTFHWDLTPANVLLAPGPDGAEHANVLGFGISRLIRESIGPDQTGPTGRGSGPNANRYLAPELREGGKADARADVFGVAALLHHMLTGAPPGPGSPAPPGKLAGALARGMAERPEDRPQDPATFGFIVAEALHGESERPPFAPSAKALGESFAPPPHALGSPLAAPAAPVDLPPIDDYEAPTTVSEMTPDMIAALSSAEPPPPMEPAMLPPIAESEPPTAIAEMTPDMMAALESPSPLVSPRTSGSGFEVYDDVAMPAVPAEPLAPPTPVPVAPAFNPFAVSAPPAAAAPAPASAPPRPTGPVDPFAPVAPPGGGAPLDLSAFESNVYEAEKSRGSAVAAIIVLVIALGIVATFFFLRATT